MASHSVFLSKESLMKEVHMPKKEEPEQVPMPVYANFLPIAVQIHLKGMYKRLDKSRNRAKSKRWRKEW